MRFGTKLARLGHEMLRKLCYFHPSGGDKTISKRHEVALIHSFGRHKGLRRRVCAPQSHSSADTQSSGVVLGSISGAFWEPKWVRERSKIEDEFQLQENSPPKAFWNDLEAILVRFAHYLEQREALEYRWA